MVLNTVTVGAAVTPTVLQTCVSHYLNRKPLRQRPTAHISYHEGLQLIRSFLAYASHHTVEEFQAFTSQRVPHPSWVKVNNVVVPAEVLTQAANALIAQLGDDGIKRFGGTKWWQWRKTGDELKAEWMEMRGDYNARQKRREKATRIMLYVHGGGYFFGSVDEHRYQMQRHARKLGAKVFAPRYRLAPQFPFPCGLQDCLAAYMYLLKEHEPSEIILAGDSAGGGMVVSMLVILRDQGLALPAGGILLSPWVDLSHSFPSVAGDDGRDYIPAHGFMQKPSAAWPPPSEDEIEGIARGGLIHSTRKNQPRNAGRNTRRHDEAEARQTSPVSLQQEGDKDGSGISLDKPAGDSDYGVIDGTGAPTPANSLSIEIDGKTVVLKDQIHMYATNHQISHPLVSPVLQPSLGGLPPLLILTGGGELLRDEQIYLAHKAANPAKYPPSDVYLNQYDPDGIILSKFKPTNVQLQVWDDLCHVAVALSFTRPAKFMYRSVGQFGAWALARAQQTSIEILGDDDVSVISSSSDTESSINDAAEKIATQEHVDPTMAHRKAQIGKAGSPLPKFINHMIRQQVDRHGVVHQLAPAQALPALQLAPAEIGTIKPGPIHKWLLAKQQWDSKYAKQKRKIQKVRLQEVAKSGAEQGWGTDEHPPPTAVAGRQRVKGEDEAKVEARRRSSWGLMLWSSWGSKHDESTLKREEDMVRREEKEQKRSMLRVRRGVDERRGAAKEDLVRDESEESNLHEWTFSGQRSSVFSGQDVGVGRSRSRRRTITVTDAGQTDEQEHEPVPQSRGNTSVNDAQSSQLTPSFVTRHNRVTSLRSDAIGDSSSIRTANTTGTAGQESFANASTTAVFAAPGIVQPGVDEARNGMPSTTRPETPASGRSVERLLAGQDHDAAALEQLRNPSTVAIIGKEGVIVDGIGGKHGSEAFHVNGTRSQPHRPGMYDRGGSEFKTAMEKL